MYLLRGLHPPKTTVFHLKRCRPQLQIIILGQAMLVFQNVRAKSSETFSLPLYNYIYFPNIFQFFSATFVFLNLAALVLKLPKKSVLAPGGYPG